MWSHHFPDWNYLVSLHHPHKRKHKCLNWHIKPFMTGFKPCCPISPLPPHFSSIKIKLTRGLHLSLSSLTKAALNICVILSASCSFSLLFTSALSLHATLWFTLYTSTPNWSLTKILQILQFVSVVTLITIN